MRRTFAIITVFVVLSLSLCLLADGAKGATDFPKTDIRIICPYSPGGGFDRQARGIAPYWQKHLPKKVNVIVENMPGAGGLVAAHHVWNAKPNGYRILQSGVGPSLIEQYVNPKEISFRMAEFVWIGQYRKDIRALGIHPKLPVKNWDDLMKYGQKRPVLFGTAGLGSPPYKEAKLISAITGLRIDYVNYPGSKVVQAGMARGEVEAICLNFNSLMRWGEDVKILLLWDDERHPLIPDIPTAIEAGVPEKYYKKIMSLPVIGTPRAFACPPGTPADVAKVLRDSFLAAMQDSEYKAWIKKAKEIYGPIVEGEDFGKVIKAMDKSINENMDLIQSIAK